MQLLLELFVKDLARSREFYTRVLGFEIREQKAGGYTGMRNGDQGSQAVTRPPAEATGAGAKAHNH